MVDPVCPLLLALYGHPEAGGWWEDHSKEQLESVGFREIPDWKSCFWHDKLKLFLVVYVDDFKLSGPKNALPIGWSLIRSKIKTDDPTPAGRYLGCDHLIVEKFIPKDKNPFATAGGNLQQEEKIKVRAMIYNMSNFLKSCVDRYLELAKCDKSKLKKVATPFLDDNKIKRDEDDDDLIWPLSASGKKTKNINTKGEDHSSAGTLADIACKVLMKVLYAARMARYDLLKAVSLLASRVTKWDKTCDLELHRLMCYINSTLDLTLISYVGDPIDALEVRLYTDADFAGDSGNSRSTSGTFLCISGPHSSAPLSGQSKKQTAVSHSTPEAEIISADHGVRNSGLPAIGLWEVLLGKKLVLKLEEDNSAAKRVAETGRNPTMRHLNRTHKVDLRFLHEQIENGNMIIVQCPTDRMCADIFTKSFTNAEKWYHACNLIGHVYPSQINWIDHRSDKICGNHRPATPATPRYDRVIIEFCCGNQSRIGNWADKFEGCKSRRLTIEEDMTTESGLKTALDWVKEAKSEGQKVLLWGALPCTGGSAWQNINKRYPGAAAKIRIHLKVFRMLFRNFITVARAVLECQGGVVVNEWPVQCNYWKRGDVVKEFESIMKSEVKIHGCALGLKSIVYPDMFIKKPWKLASSCPAFLEPFRKFICDKSHDHTPCAGKDTKNTESYTDMFAKLVNQSFSNVCKHNPHARHNYACCAIPVSAKLRTKALKLGSSVTVDSRSQDLAHNLGQVASMTSFALTNWQKYLLEATYATLDVFAPADAIALKALRISTPAALANLCIPILKYSPLGARMSEMQMRAFLDAEHAGIYPGPEGVMSVPLFPHADVKSSTDFKILVLGDSSLELKKSKGWSTCEAELKWKLGLPAGGATVACKPGADGEKLVSAIVALGSPKYDAIIVVWALNDLCVNKKWRTSIPAYKELIEKFVDAVRAAMFSS